MSRALALWATLTILACGGGDRPADEALLRQRPSPDAQMRGHCQLTARRCSQCHPLARVLRARVANVAQWRAYVERMRLMGGSNIRLAEQSAILRCLAYGSFGEQGLAALAAEEVAP